MAHIEPSVKWKKNKEKKIKKIMEMTCGMWRKVVGSSPTLINSCRRTKKGEREEKKKRKKKIEERKEKMKI